jgi:uridine kinase
MQNKPLVIGVAGGSGSGKSTLAARIVGALEGLTIVTMPMDRYFLKVKPKMVAPYTGLTYEDHNHPESFDLEGLVRDLDALLEQAEPPQVVIVEGLMTLHDARIRSRLDLKIFLDVQADERIVRRLRRNMAHGLPFDDIAAFYLDSVRHRHQEFVEPSRWHADIVLNGSIVSTRGVDLVTEWVRQHAPWPKQKGETCRPSNP